VNRKIQYLCLAVQEINPRAVKIYQKFGFREVLRENGSIKMRKELGSRGRMDKPL
jgi:ribosomal protein S18 acetylase RimI-like enzyme